MRKYLLTFLLIAISTTSSFANSKLHLNFSSKCKRILVPALQKLDMELKDLDNKESAKAFKSYYINTPHWERFRAACGAGVGSCDCATFVCGTGWCTFDCGKCW